MIEQAPAGSAADAARSRRPLTTALWALLAVLTAAAIAIPFVTGGAGPPRSVNTVARLAVRHALTASLGETTVQITFTASLTGASVNANLSGTGALDLATKSAAMHLTGSVAGQRESASVEVLTGVVYVDVPEIAAMDPGKSWLSLRPGAGTGLGSSVGGLGTFADPASILPFLRRSGATVTTLGASTRDGTTVRGYRVVLGAAALGSAGSAAGLPASIAGQVHQVAVTVYVAGNLLRSIEVIETGQTSLTASIDFHGYGQPVSVQAPAATAVVPFSQFAGGAGLPVLSNPA